MTLEQKARQLVELRAEITKHEDELKAIIEPLREKRDKIQEDILLSLKRSKQFSARYSFATITRAVRKTPQVVDERKVIAYLTAQGLDKEYVAPRLAPHFDAFAKQAMKEGIEVDGMHVKETEYISISKPAEEGDRRKIVAD
jgi:hypothetical protein